jgi:hypothetical protein
MVDFEVAVAVLAMVESAEYLSLLAGAEVALVGMAAVAAERISTTAVQMAAAAEVGPHMPTRRPATLSIKLALILEMATPFCATRLSYR